MNYYKDATGEVFYYDDQQLAIVDLINSSTDLEILNQIPGVFFKINDAIKSMSPLTLQEIEQHINPPVAQ